MIYDIKAIPTTYAGVNFRSRLEARWAAFFDLANLKWEYEPFDLEGWAPDFLLRTRVCNVLCEVKPSDLTSLMDDAIENGTPHYDIPAFSKATRHARVHQVLCLGSSPIETRLPMPIGVPTSPPRGTKYSYDDVIDALHVHNQEELWREAGNVVQWIPPEPKQKTVTEMIDTGLLRARGILTVKERKTA